MHHILLRTPKRGKGSADRQFTSELRRRFRLWADGDKSTLVSEWINQQTDSRRTKTKKQKPEEDIQANKAKKAVTLVLQGHIRRAVRMVENNQPLANMQTTKVQEQAKAKHPTRKEEDYWSSEDIEEREKLEVSTQKFIRLPGLRGR